MATYVVSFTPETWEKFYPKALNRGSTKWHWSRLEVSFFTDPEFLELTPAERLFYLYMVGLSAEAMRPDNIKVGSELAVVLFRMSEEQIVGTLDWLASHEKVTYTWDGLPKSPANDFSNKSVPHEEQSRNANVAQGEQSRNASVTNPSRTSNKSVPQNKTVDKNDEQSSKDLEKQGLRNKSVPHEEQSRNASVTNPFPYGRTDITKQNIITPIVPLQADSPKPKKIGRKEMDAYATTLVGGALRLLREEKTEQEALAFLGEKMMKVLLFEFGDWRTFEAAARREAAAGYLQRFRNDTLDAVKKTLYLSIKAESNFKIPTLAILPGGDNRWPN